MSSRDQTHGVWTGSKHSYQRGHLATPYANFLGSCGKYWGFCRFSFLRLCLTTLTYCPPQLTLRKTARNHPWTEKSCLLHSPTAQVCQRTFHLEPQEERGSNLYWITPANFIIFARYGIFTPWWVHFPYNLPWQQYTYEEFKREATDTCFIYYLSAVRIWKQCEQTFVSRWLNA